MHQRVCIWDWTDESDSPQCQVDLSPKYGCQVCCKNVLDEVIMLTLLKKKKHVGYTKMYLKCV